MTNAADVATDKISRRRLLQTGAVGAGVAGAAWVTPAVLRADGASAVGSACGTLRTMVWPTSGGNQVPSGNTSSASFSNWIAYSVGGTGATGIRVRVSFTTGTGVTRRGPGIAVLGGVAANSNFQINKNNATTGATATILVEFLHPTLNQPRSVGNLDVTLLDVDKSCGTSGNFTDAVVVAASNYGSAVTPSMVTQNTTYVAGAYPTFTGILDAAGTGNTGGNVRLQFQNQYLTQIAFTYRSDQAISCPSSNCGCSGTPVNPSSTQYFGINNFTFC